MNIAVVTKTTPDQARDAGRLAQRQGLRIHHCPWRHGNEPELAAAWITAYCDAQEEEAADRMAARRRRMLRCSG